jgi:hypothetical protein
MRTTSVLAAGDATVLSVDGGGAAKAAVDARSAMVVQDKQDRRVLGIGNAPLSAESGELPYHPDFLCAAAG